jgi:hypothetical protein
MRQEASSMKAKELDPCSFIICKWCTDISVLELKFTKSFIYILTKGEGVGGGGNTISYKYCI